jgi:hypothetical protein
MTLAVTAVLVRYALVSPILLVVEEASSLAAQQHRRAGD